MTTSIYKLHQDGARHKALKQAAKQELEQKCKQCFIRCESTKEIMNCDTCTLRAILRGETT